MTADTTLRARLEALGEHVDPAALVPRVPAATAAEAMLADRLDTFVAAAVDLLDTLDAVAPAPEATMPPEAGTMTEEFQRQVLRAIMDRIAAEAVAEAEPHRHADLSDDLVDRCAAAVARRVVAGMDNATPPPPRTEADAERLERIAFVLTIKDQLGDWPAGSGAEGGTGR